MRNLRTRSARSFDFLDTRDDDEVFIVEAILKRDKSNYLVKFLSYEPEWIESNLIPSLLLEHFITTGQSRIPYPNKISSISTGNIVYKALTWKTESNLPTWTQDNDAEFPMNIHFNYCCYILILTGRISNL